MTHEPENPERDPALDTAWREHSAEMPPARLDATILAAAHRAVGSGPQGVGKQAAEATSPQRWWMPLAAAATIGAVALGILQTMPQEPPVNASSVSDMPTPATAPASSLPSEPREKRVAAERQNAPRAVVEADKQQIRSPVASPMVSPANLPAAPPAIPPAHVPEQLAGKALAPRAADSVEMPSASMGATPQPFPAEKKRETAESADFKDRAGAAGALSDTPGASPFSAPARHQAESSSAPPPPMAAAPAPARMTAAREDTRQRNEAAQSVPAASGTVALGKTAASVDAGAAKAIDVDGWIIRIRKLHDEGKLTDAARELAALRAAIPDADRRLPPELRAWAATVKP
jgi:hypothetical protein